MVILMQYKEQIMVDEIRRIMSVITGRDFRNINENISIELNKCDIYLFLFLPD